MLDFFRSHLRTYVPIWAGALAAWLASKGFDLDVNATVIVVTGLATSGYYTLARLLEQLPSTAWLGKFLLSVGFVPAPVYGGGGTSSAVPAGDGVAGGEGYNFSSGGPRV